MLFLAHINNSISNRKKHYNTKNSIKNFNKNEYLQEIQKVEPFEKFKKTALNADKIILKNIEQFKIALKKKLSFE